MLDPENCLGLRISISKAEFVSKTITQILVLLPSKLFPFIFHLGLNLFLYLFIKYLWSTYYQVIGTLRKALIR